MKSVSSIHDFLARVPDYIFTGLVCAAILAMTLLPVRGDIGGIRLFPHADKVVHFLMFGTLAAVWWWEECRRRGLAKATIHMLWLPVVASIAIGGIVELLQDAMNMGRSAELADFIADSLGAICLPLILWRLIDYMLRKAPRVTLSKLGSDDAYLGELSELYHTSFPPEERREWNDILERSESQSCPLEFLVIIYRREVAGMITCWHLPGFDYVEHFAVKSSLRGKGIGADAIRKLVARAGGVPIVLEVEPATDGPIAARRIRFYERCGFTGHTEFKYIQPPYAPGLPPVRLMLMSSSSGLDIGRVAAVLHKEVYGK
ncbi:MAG: GNAT family N-acetyltransferase [Muribaculaceae bacterium]|nr:GNAT family N-acetyltransferase [Muribaculaceae bacterium]